MKKFLALFMCIFFVVPMFSGCKEKYRIDDRRIIGTWVFESHDFKKTYTFNADHTASEKASALDKYAMMPENKGYYSLENGYMMLYFDDELPRKFKVIFDDDDHFTESAAGIIETNYERVK